MANIVVRGLFGGTEKTEEEVLNPVWWVKYQISCATSYANEKIQPGKSWGWEVGKPGSRDNMNKGT